jgi:carbamoylphosphate synthase large subunit
VFFKLEEAIEAAKKIKYPVMVRVAYALGGLGSGIVKNEKELTELCGKVVIFYAILSYNINLLDF